MDPKKIAALCDKFKADLLALCGEGPAEDAADTSGEDASDEMRDRMMQKGGA